MNEFELNLRRRVGVVYRELAAARADGEDYAGELHAARLEELYDLARRHGIDVAAPVDVDAAIPRQDRS
ncbi:hypothetical protein [Amycolatopsis tolypomycina]|uniref:Uncharacterized protein n=1 Tax=Amycolatopsis tolypomycina TaxID=208445 RepID=A0A1H4WBL1_9PSEU|nr:hypothetical protein [Amycolatopsis tolypomycina]SEC90772.1 hypothetical protein SAMN04489727_5546 [Amycolatopsis tolypomycina]